MNNQAKLIPAFCGLFPKFNYSHFYCGFLVDKPGQ